MNIVDIAIIAVLIVSAIISYTRGFFKEALSLAAWITSVWVATQFAPSLSALAEPYISVPTLRLGAAFLLLFLVTLILFSMANHLVAQLIKKTGFGGTDRAVGVVFGLMRGGVIVVVLVVLAGVTTMPQQPWWQDSHFVGYFQSLAYWLQGNLPDGLAGDMRLDL